jgi:hypothetical protein
MRCGKVHLMKPATLHRRKAGFRATSVKCRIAYRSDDSASIRHVARFETIRTIRHRQYELNGHLFELFDKQERNRVIQQNSCPRLIRVDITQCLLERHVGNTKRVLSRSPMLHVDGCHHPATLSLPHSELIALGHRLSLNGSDHSEFLCLESMEGQHGAAVVLFCSVTRIVAG